MDGKPIITLMDNQGVPYQVDNGYPTKMGWYQIVGATDISKVMTFFYALGTPTSAGGVFGVYGPPRTYPYATPSLDPCRTALNAPRPSAGSYNLTCKYDIDGSSLFNATYDYFTAPWYIYTPPTTDYFCGTPRMTCYPPSGQSTFLPGTYTISYSWGSTPTSAPISLNATVTVEAPPPVVYGPTRQYTGQWIKSDENAWGLSVLMNFSDPSYIFVPWYTYDSSGKASWYLFQGSATDGNGKWTANDTFTANVFRYSGPTWGVPYDSSKWGGTQVGTATLKFIDPTTATFAYDVDNSSRSITLSKWDGDYPMGQYSGQWIKVNSYGVADEMGWGLTVLQTFHTPNTIFVPWYTYDASGNAQWYLFQGEGVPLPVMNTYQLSAPPTATNPSGGVTVCRFHGPSWGVFPYDNSQTEDGNTCTATGSATLTFTDQTHAVFQYNNVDGGSGTINLVKLQ